MVFWPAGRPKSTSTTAGPTKSKVIDCQGFYMFLVAAFELSVYIKYVACHSSDLSCSLLVSWPVQNPRLACKNFPQHVHCRHSYIECQSHFPPELGIVSLSLSLCLCFGQWFEVLWHHSSEVTSFTENIFAMFIGTVPWRHFRNTSWSQLGVFWKVAWEASNSSRNIKIKQLRSTSMMGSKVWSGFGALRPPILKPESLSSFA